MSNTIETPAAPSTETLSDQYLKTGEQYVESLRDGREVWYQGERVEDVTEHPALAAGIRWNAEIYDAQFDPEVRDLVTWNRDGDRISTSWLLPTTKEDLARCRRCAEFMAWKTAAWMGRQPDMITWTQRGMNGLLPTFLKYSQEYGSHLTDYLTHAQNNNVHMAAVVVEPQGDRARAGRAGADRSAVLHVEKRDSKGIYIRGARAVGSYSPQANELMVGNINGVPALQPNESFWATIPINTPGVKMVCRETVTKYGASEFNHPIARKGDEMDAFVIFHDAFIPYERVFSLDAPELHDHQLFSEMSRGEHWHVLNRFTIRAEILLGLTQLVVNALGTAGIPVIRDQVGKIIEFVQTLRAGVIAAEEAATPTEGGVLLPDMTIVAAVRSYGLGMYPQIVHIVQELCGQGLVMRFSEEDFAQADIGSLIETYMEAKDLTAREKNRLMNAVWDYTVDSHAGRSALFENVNALPAFTLRQRLYDEFDRDEIVDRVAGLVGLQFK